MRLIDADKIPYVDLSDGKKVCIVAFAEKINQMPTIEPERKTGRWMATEADEPCFYRCSECGRLIDERENYCPNCGARLEGEG